MENKTISIVIPMFNEAENIVELYREIKEVTFNHRYDFEIVYVNDGSTDKSEAILHNLYKHDRKHIKVINFYKNQGKALALKAGFSMASGDIFFTMDGDLQDDPREIPKFIEKINEGHDLVTGWKYRRKDSFIKNKTSKIYNLVTSITSGIYLHDHNCGFKAYRKEVAKKLPLQSQLHRYTPLLAQAIGYDKITEIKVNHRKRSYGKSKYGPSRFVFGITGLVQALWISQKMKSSAFKTSPVPEYVLKSVLV